MLAGVLHGARDLRAEEVDSPSLGTGQVLLRVRRAGICGSDIHYYMHGYCGAFVPTRPFVLGHEFVADVEEIGPDVSQPTVGQRVVVNPATSCGQCERCKSGRGNLCENVVMLGSASTTPPTDGAFAEHVVVPAHQCHLLPESVDDATGAMVEPLSVALHAIHRGGSVAGSRVLVTGGGPIGLLTAIVARAYGASLVVISELNESRRAMATSLAADQTLDPTEVDFVQQAMAISDGGFDYMFEASGAAPAVRSGFDVVRRGGTIVQIGTVDAGEVSLPVNELMVHEISLLGTFRYANEFSAAVRLLAGKRIDVAPLVTGEFALAEISQALEAACSIDGTLKVHVAMDT
jgi:2-desacetyl-2-hydroxyethyl bacteriochlorophyllide A dehydrogenase